MRMLQEQPDPAADASAQFDVEYRREVFRWAAARVRGAVAESTWQAFWQTTAGGQPIADVARLLGMSVGSVYIARSRVMARLRDEVSRHERSSGTYGSLPTQEYRR